MQTIVISRTDNLGDVMLTLPLAGYLKSHFSLVRIGFIGKTYTKPLIDACEHIDFFIDREQLIAQPSLLEGVDTMLFIFPDKEVAKASREAGVRVRVGTSHRWFHWWYANKRVNFSRRRSALHEAQLNFKLLQGIGIDITPTFEQIVQWYGFTNIMSLPPAIAQQLQPDKTKVIMHPKSRGSAREWKTKSYYETVKALNPQRFQVLITGTAQEGESIRRECAELLALPHVVDFTGKLSLSELISVVAQAQALIACSTGPLHIAAACGLLSIGIYAPMIPIHPARWQPIGANVAVLCQQKACEQCRHTLPCFCIENISPQEVLEMLRG